MHSDGNILICHIVIVYVYVSCVFQIKRINYCNFYHVGDASTGIASHGVDREMQLG